LFDIGHIEYHKIFRHTTEYSTIIQLPLFVKTVLTLVISAGLLSQVIGLQHEALVDPDFPRLAASPAEA